MTNSLLPIDATQRELAVDVRHSYVVSAPAGSGKTGLLTLRVLKLLQIVSQPEEILAITFTKKAANEMRERIYDALTHAHACPADSVEFAEADSYTQTVLRAGHEALKRSTEKHWRLLDNPQRINISTIDGLCKSLCNALPLFSGLGSKAGILDVPDLHYEATVNSWLKRNLQDVNNKHLESLIRHFGGKLDRLVNMLAKLLAVREQWLPLVIHARHNHSNIRPRFEAVLAAWIEQAIDHAQQSLRIQESDILECLRYATGNQAEAIDASQLLILQAHLDQFPSGIHSLPWWQALTELMMVKNKELAYRKRLDKNVGFPTGTNAADKKLCKSKKDSFLKVLAECAEYPEILANLAALRELPPAQYSDEQWQIIDSLLHILPELAAELKIQFSEQAKTDFSEISMGAVTALNSQIGDMDLLQRLDYSLHHLLIDEFQDTSQLQLQLLQALTQAWLPDDGRSLFLVGDAMQSCYGFRNANVGIF